MMPTRETIVEGTSKILYEHTQPGMGVLHFQDPAGCGGIRGYGVINAGLSGLLMQRMEFVGIATHFIKSYSSREHLVKLVETMPVFASVHNVVTHFLARRFGITEGTPLSRSIVEFHLKDHDLGHPVITQEHAMAFGWCSAAEWDDMASQAARVNDFLVGQFSALHIDLLSFQVEFGRHYGSSVEEDQLMICDELSLGTCTLKDLRTGCIHKPFEGGSMTHDADAFYQEIARRFGIMSEIYQHPVTLPPLKGKPHLTVVESRSS